MRRSISGDDKLGDIVAEYPGAGRLFKEARIDFCCGGDRSLREAIRQGTGDENELLRQLNEAYDEWLNKGKKSEKDWRTASIGDLIDHIVDRHHAYLRLELPLISEYVTKILRVHGGKHDELFMLHKLYHQMKIELEQHLIAEEEKLFPLLKQYAAQPTVELYERAIRGLMELEADHNTVGDYVKEMRLITNEYALPSDACGTFTLAYRKLDELETDLYEHIHLENNVLFPRFEG